MNDELIADLKQFIVATVSQSTTEIRGDITSLDERVSKLDERVSKLDGRVSKLDGRLSTMDSKLDDIQAAIGDAITNANDAAGARLDDHERRLARIEHRGLTGSIGEAQAA